MRSHPADANLFVCNVMVLQSRHIRQRALIPSIRGRHRMADARAVRSPPSPAAQLAVLPKRPIETQQFLDGWPPLWWVGCHGGAGTTTLARITGPGIRA